MMELGRRGFMSRRDIVKGAVAGGLAISAAGVLAGCGGGESETATSTEVPESARKRGGVLRVGVAGGGKGNLDPHAPSHAGVDAVFPNLYDKIVNLDPKTFKAFPQALESIEPNAKGDRWTLRLRKGLTFHNGAAATADDLVFTFEHMQGENASTAGVLALLDLKAVKKVDPLTVRLDLGSPSGIVDELLAADQCYFIPKDFDPEAGVGTGAFKLKSRKSGEQTSFTKFADYWDADNVFLDEVVVTEFADATSRVNAFLANQLDVIDSIPVAQRRIVEADPARQILVTENSGWRGVAMNVNSKLFNSPEAREGLRLIVDRKQLLVQAYGGAGSIANDLYSPSDPVFAKDLPQRAHDPEKGMALLRQAGVADQAMVLRTNTGAAGLKELGQVFSQQATAAGLKMKVQIMDSNAFYAGDYLNYPLGTSYWTTYPYLYQVAQIEWGKKAPYNQTGLNDPEFNDLASQATRELDEAKRRELAGRMQRIQHDRGGLVIPAFVDALDAATKKVVGFIPDKRGLPLTSYQFKFFSLAS